MLKFTKMHGCGNDYIYFNCFSQKVENPEKLSIALSDRHFGIGGDGIVLICPSDVCDAKMRMFNADGSEGKMCGNAIRCVGKYLSDEGIVSGDEITVETLSGNKILKLEKSGDGKVLSVTVNMGKAEFEAEKIPVTFDEKEVIGKKVTINEKEEKITCVSMGNPHCVIFTDDTDSLDLEKIGPKYENFKLFPDRINTEFVEIIDDKTLKMRVWERGSGETLACGTGACAVVSAAVANGICKKDTDVTVKLLGGDLKIKYTDDAVFMTGSATRVFDGEVDETKIL